MWDQPETSGQLISQRRLEQELQLVSEDSNTQKVSFVYVFA